MRGRKPKPTWLKVVAGNPGKAPLNDAEPIPQGELRDPPAHWTAPTFAPHRELWQKVMRDSPPGLLRRLDSETLEAWVNAAVIYRDAAERVARIGSMVRAPGSGYPMQNPYLSVMNKQAEIMRKHAAEMGFTPSARSRVRIEKGKGASAGAFDDLPDLNDA